MDDILENIIEDLVAYSINSEDITSSAKQTKDWRKEQEWYITGKKNECEIYQRAKIEEITSTSCIKTNKRFNYETLSFTDVRYPNKQEDGFEYTEDMDGYQALKGCDIYYNLKMICNSGGAQTRSLREVYMLIRCQLDYMVENDTKIIFVNILDGNEAHKTKNKFEYLMKKPIYQTVKPNIFVGDLDEFYEWFILFNR